MIYKDWKQRVVIRWFLWATLCACLGSVLHFINVIPINKNLWSSINTVEYHINSILIEHFFSSKNYCYFYNYYILYRSLSFVLVSTAFSLVFLSVCYLLMDITTIWQGGPFRIPGRYIVVLIKSC